jgi:N,N'-diacetyllegionaminate synthase
VSKTFVIAELGSCHHNDLGEAKALIEVAKACGANAAKFQYWSSAKRMAWRRHVPSYEAMYEQYRLPIEWVLELKDHADSVGIEFMCSTFCPEDVSIIAPLVKTMKIASFEANDPQHLVAHVEPLKARKRIIISLGLDASAGVVREWLIRHNENANVSFLRCVSAYPAPIQDLQLIRLRPARWSEAAFEPSGLSDHSDPSVTMTGALAVAAGAGIVERHMRSATTPKENPDYPHAMSPSGFAEYVDNIRFAELAVGERSEPVPSETPLRALRVRE